MLIGPNTTAVIRWGIKHGYPHHVLMVMPREHCADALAWAFRRVGPKGVVSWTYTPPNPAVFLFADPDAAFEFKMRWG